MNDTLVFNIAEWQAEGWKVEEDDGRFEVYYHTHERMRIGADGSLGIGRPDGYWFNTREWAELCAKRLNSLERAFYPSVAITTTGNFGIGSSAHSSWNSGVVFQIRPDVTRHAIMEINQHGQVTKFDLPAFFMAWWRGTTAYRAWRVLMWGEKA